jgi:hypothetical protein
MTSLLDSALLPDLTSVLNILGILTRLGALTLLIILLRRFVAALRMNGNLLRALSWVIGAILFLAFWFSVPEVLLLVLGWDARAVRPVVTELRVFSLVPYGFLAGTVALLLRALDRAVATIPHEKGRGPWTPFRR